MRAINERDRAIIYAALKFDGHDDYRNLSANMSFAVDPPIICDADAKLSLDLNTRLLVITVSVISYKCNKRSLSHQLTP